MTDLIENTRGLEGRLRGLQVTLTKIVRVHMERLFEVLQSLTKVSHSNLQLAEICVHLSGHNVGGAEYFETAVDT